MKSVNDKFMNIYKGLPKPTWPGWGPGLSPAELEVTWLWIKVNGYTVLPRISI